MAIAKSLTWKTDDALKRMATVLDAAGTTTYGYDAGGIQLSHGVSIGNGYDTLNRLSSMQSTCGATASGFPWPN